MTEQIDTFPPQIKRVIEELFVFDIRCNAPRELWLTILPQLAYIRRAWRNLYLSDGCVACPKPDPTIAICARMRKAGLEWSQIYEMIDADYERSTLPERKHFKALVKRKMVELAQPPRPLPKEQLADYRSKHYHAAGGFCDKCRNRYKRRLAKELTKLHANRERDTEKMVAALSQRFDAAQWLLNGPDE